MLILQSRFNFITDEIFKMTTKSIQRIVRKLEPLDGKLSDISTQSFSEYFDVPNIILLGDPGSGKTYTFTAGAKKEGALFLSVRNFLARKGRGCENKKIYLDGLDEFRSRMDGTNAINKVIEILYSLECPDIRISCREADWLGEADLSSFKDYFGSRPYAVISLEPLEENEVASILKEKGVKRPEEFIKKAEVRGLEGLLTNPQTLIMLQKIAKNGSWPKTKCQLFQFFTDKLLTEHNPIHQRKSDLGEYSSKELYDSAGATCASLLISNVTGISLLGNDNLEEFPSYKDIPTDDTNKVLASLTREAFSSVNSGSESVTYIHRTVAEFLAAKWLTLQVQNGLPVGRIKSLICFDGHPTPELRGLHAWLATLLPEHASTLISKDPFGILMYGDPASMSPSDRQSLLQALEKLSKVDPWFHSRDCSDQLLGALSGQDMIKPFKKILSNHDSTDHLRSIVLAAIKNGPSLPEIEPDLVKIITGPTTKLREQSESVDAMLNVVPDGALKIEKVFRATLAKNPSSAQLRARILSKTYIDQFNPADIFSVFNDMLADDKDYALGTLGNLAHSLPNESLPCIIDQLCTLKLNNISNMKKNDIKYAFSIMLARTLESNASFDSKQVWTWLLLHSKLNGRDSQKRIKGWLSQNQPALYDIFKIAYDELDKESTSHWAFLNNFQDVTMQSFSTINFARCAIEILQSKETYKDKEFYLYEICGSLIFSLSDSDFSNNLFEEFYYFANNNQQLIKVRDQVCWHEISGWRIEQNISALKHKQETEDRVVQDISTLLEAKERIRSGQELGLIGWLAKRFLSNLESFNGQLPSTNKLQTEIGEELFKITLDGFSAVINRKELPTPTDIALKLSKGRIYTWWHAILAGMDEAWLKKGTLCDFPGKLLKSALAMTIEFPSNSDGDNKPARQWFKRIYIERPTLAENVFEDIARIELNLRTGQISILYTLATSEHTRPWRAKLGLKLLSDFPSTPPRNLGNLLHAVIFDQQSHHKLIKLAISTINKRGCVTMQQRAQWLATGFLLAYSDFQAPLANYSKQRDWVIWSVRDIIGYSRHHTQDGSDKLSIVQYEFLIHLFGAKFKNTPYPYGEVLSGNQNPCDASQFILDKINALSANNRIEASLALKRLLNNSTLASYHSNLKHALASQTIIYREAKFKQPTWHDTTETLKGGSPANIEDLHALTLNHLETLKYEILNSNTDKYNTFWRCDQHKKAEKPQVENYCRDRLIEMLAHRLSPLKIRVEPEGHMANDKRADIMVLPPPGLKLLLELKRETHKDLWTACKDQLERWYTRDPEASDHGIYVVFWFGEKRSGSIPKPPNGTGRPKSAKELEESLNKLISSEKKRCLHAIVIDVSPPVEQVKKKMSKKKS